MKRGWISLLLIVGLCFSSLPALAQESQPAGPVYIVQSGDTLWDIAARFGVTVDELIAANGISDASTLKPDDELVIPGLEGVQGILTTETVAFGENLRSLSRRHQVPVLLLTQLNHLTSPAELYAGANLIVPLDAEAQVMGQRAGVSLGQSLLEVAALQGANPWTLVQANALQGTWQALPGEVLFAPGEEQAGQGALPPALAGVNISPLPLVQGKTTRLRVSVSGVASLQGSLAGKELHFFSAQAGELVALQGVHAMLEPGLYPLRLSAALEDGTNFEFSQLVRVSAGDFLFDLPLTVDPGTVDPAVTKPEDEQWNALVLQATPERMWTGLFTSPVAPIFSDCWPSLFGSRRSYNDSGYQYFHTGLDFCGGVGDDVYAAAPGVVVFAGSLSVRGNATMIDHGWGIYTGYMHQSELLVQVGEQVEAGQLIGRVGGTGRVTGPHLHWEVWAGGVQVEPLDWLEQEFP